MSGRATVPVLVEGVALHLLELDLLWEQREASVFSEILTLEDLADLEARADAHLDGVVLSGRVGGELAREALASGEAGAVCAGAMSLLALSEADPVLSALESADADTAVGLCWALRHGTVSWDENALRGLAASAAPITAACAADALVFRRRSPAGDVERLVAVDDPVVQRLALAALARSGEALSGKVLEHGLASEDAEVRLDALRAAAWTRLPGLAERCRTLLAGRGEAAAQALSLLGSLGLPEDLETLTAVVGDAKLGVDAILSLGAFGAPSSVPLLLDLLSDPELAPAASSAFVRICGPVELGVPRAAVPRGPDDPNADFAPNEPRIDEQAARALWQRSRRSFRPELRHQAGRVAPRAPDAVFAELPLLIRRDLALGSAGRGEAAFARYEPEARAIDQRG